MFSNSVLFQFYSTIDTFTVSERKNRDRKTIIINYYYFFIIYLNLIENKLFFKKLKIYNNR